MAEKIPFPHFKPGGKGLMQKMFLQKILGYKIPLKLYFSGYRSSTVLKRLSVKAFRVPHIDHGHGEEFDHIAHDLHFDLAHIIFGDVV